MKVADGTIQQDVSNEGEEQERPLSARELMLEQIGTKIEDQQQVQEESADITATTDPAAGRIVDDLQMLVRVKVNGKEEERPLAEVLTGYQKNEAASERLRLAAVKEKNLDAREKALGDIERQVQLQTQLPADEGTDDTDLTGVISALVEGDNEAAVKALRLAINKGREPITTPQSIDEEALSGRIEQKMEGKKAWDGFLAANPEFADEQSRERQYGDYLFTTKYQPLIATGETSYHQALLDAAAEVKGTFTPPPAVKTERELKLARKQALDVLPIASGARRASVIDEPEETNADIITQMRKGRGLPV